MDLPTAVYGMEKGLDVMIMDTAMLTLDIRRVRLAVHVVVGIFLVKVVILKFYISCFSEKLRFPKYFKKDSLKLSKLPYYLHDRLHSLLSCVVGFTAVSDYNINSRFIVCTSLGVFDLSDNIHTLYNMSKDNMLIVQVWSISRSNEKLRAIGARSGICHR